MGSVKCLVFDFDNTIAKNVKPTDFGILELVRRYNLSTEDEVLLNVIQKATSDYEICERLVPEDQRDVVYNKILQLNRKNVEQVFYSPEVVGLIRFLKDTYVLDVVSGRDSFSLTHSLQQQGLLDCFREVIGGDSGFKPKPSPESLHYLMNMYGLAPSDVVYVGDSITDYLTARHAACLFIGVGWYDRVISGSEVAVCLTTSDFMEALRLL